MAGRHHVTMLVYTTWRRLCMTRERVRVRVRVCVRVRVRVINGVKHP